MIRSFGRGWARCPSFASWGRTLVAFLLMAALGVFTSSSHAVDPSTSASQFSVIHYEPISKTLVAGTPTHRPLYDYVYRVQVRSSASFPANVTGSVASKLGSLSITDAKADFGVVAVGETRLSTDTITVRAKRHFDRRLDTKELRDGRWQFIEPGRDNDDDHVAGLAKSIDDWRDDIANRYYDLKFQHFFKWALVVRPDISAPTISNLLPQGNKNTSTPLVSAEFTDGTDGSGINLNNVTLRIDGVDVTNQSSKTATSITYQPATALSDGVHSAVLSITDKSGNPASATWSFTIDTIAPTVTNQAPSNTTSANPGIAISAQFADTNGSGIDIPSVRLVVDGIDVTDTATKTVSEITFTPSTRLADGAHNVALTLYDMAGNSTTSAWSFGVDGTVPTVRDIVPANNSFLAAGMAQTVSAQFLDSGAGINLQTVRLEIDGQNVTAQAQITPEGISYLPVPAFEQGRRIVSLTVMDIVGNVAVQNWSFTVDTIEPVISAQSPINTAIASPNVVISAQYADAGGTGTETGKVKLLVDELDVTDLATITDSSISYSARPKLSGGSHVVVLIVQDRAGNTARAQWTFGVDGVGPVVTHVAPTSGTTLAADAIPIISAQFQDDGIGVDASKITLEVDSQDVTSQAQLTSSGIVFSPAQVLIEGNHSAKLTVTDNHGTVTVTTWEFRTATAPVVFGQTPNNTFLPGGAAPTITANFSDIGSGIDPGRIQLFFNNADVTAQAVATSGEIRYAVPQPLSDSTHQVKLVVVDKAGNVTVNEWSFGTAQPPEITATSPKDVLLPVASRPSITASFEDSRVGINTASTRLFVNGVDVTPQSDVTSAGISYTPAQPLASGPYTVYLEIANTTNAAANAVWGFEVDEEKVYNVAIISPAGPQTVTTPKLIVTASVSANKTSPVRLVLNGAEMSIAGVNAEGGVTYGGNVDLIDGINTLTVQATFSDGEVRSASTQVIYDAPPKVIITSPADKGMLGRANTTSPADLTGNVERPVTITGRVSKPVASVTINQQQATLLNDNTEFKFENYFLREGMNMLTAVATDASGRVGSAAIQVSVDQTAPILTIEAPLTNAVTSNSKIDVRGMVNDAVEAFVGAPEPKVHVTVNGLTKQGQVADRYYLVPDVPLQIGENVLTVTATDQFGNNRTQETKVSRVAVGSNRLTALSGNHQSAKSYTELAKPFTVVALNSAGEPLANLPIKFDVVRGTGSISTIQGQPTKPDGVNPARNLIVNTDSGGRAQIWMTTGKQSGVGANVVTASHPQVSETVTFTATTERGAVFKINADLGINQFAETGSQPLELLSVVVRDREDNLLPNVPVVFAIDEGDAYFTDHLGGIAQDGGKRIVLNTDKNGLAALRPTVGNTPGLIRITAKALREVTGSVDMPTDLTGDATFYIQAKPAKDGPATFRGTVYTDKGLPLSGVRVSIGRTALASTTDEQGKFELNNVPPGRIDLFIDGRTVNPTNDLAKQQWPSLHFESFVVKGQENILPHPIYLPPLLTSEAKTVGGNEDVILRIPGIDGFQMKVKANSVTFPDGSHIGTLVVSPVTADRLPMAPPAGGAAFGLPAWTIQPAGTRFDPPIEVQMPNARANPAGDNIPIVQWDHDLGQYVPMGRATVTEDGAFLVTDAGSGITKAGWGGACVYDPDKCAKNAPKCKDCEKLETSGDCPTCQWDPASADSVERQSVGGQWELWSAKNDASRIFSKIGLPKVQIKAKGLAQGALTKRCCEKTKRKERGIQASALGELEFSAEGPIPSLGFSAFGVLEFGVFARLKAAGALNVATYKVDFCKMEEGHQIAGTGSVALTGELIAKVIAEPGDPYGIEFTGGVSGGRTWVFGSPTTSFASVTIFGKGEVVFGSTRKYQLVNVSQTWTDQSTTSPQQLGAEIESAIGAQQ